MKNLIEKIRFWLFKVPNWDSVVNAYLSGDYETTLRVFKPLAENGHPDAKGFLGMMHLHGHGVPQDYEKALELCTFAAENASPKKTSVPQYHIGLMHYNGLGVKQNFEEAFKWFSLSANQGYEIAEGFLGLMYLNGKGTQLNPSLAYHWLLKAANKRNPTAQDKIGWMLIEGNGVEKDIQTGAEWIQKSAGQDSENGHVSLGRLYLTGIGVEQNIAKAYESFYQASQNGNEVAEQAMQEIEDKYPGTVALVKRAHQLIEQIKNGG